MTTRCRFRRTSAPCTNRFAQALSGQVYAHLREGGKKMLSQMPSVRELARRSEEHLKGMVLPGTLFEEMGFNYIGPVDGHDVTALVRTLRNLRKLRGPQFLHVRHAQGQGVCAGRGRSDHLARTRTVRPGQRHHLQGEEFGTVLFPDLRSVALRHCRSRPRIIGITPAMREGSGLVQFSKRFPERYFDVAIAEQHAVTFAAGLATEGLKPVVAIYSTFLQRAYDQLIHDVALQRLPVVFAVDRAGLVGSDGATHQGSYDLSYLRCIPNMVVMAPADENECRQMLYTASTLEAPAVVRYPRGTGPGVPVVAQMKPCPSAARSCGARAAAAWRCWSSAPCWIPPRR